MTLLLNPWNSGVTPGSPIGLTIFPQDLGKNLSQIRLIHQNGYISSPTQKHSRKYVNTQLEILRDAVYLFLHEHLLM